MKNVEHLKAKLSGFNLDKWFLDFANEQGEAMIFYSVRMSWKGLRIPYVGWIWHHPGQRIQSRQRFYGASTPVEKGDMFTWSDSRWKIRGTWNREANLVQERLHESENGCLDWVCHQPSSQVEIHLNDEIFTGKGYLEQLRLTIYPWLIPIRSLRWGRFACEGHCMVWISFTGKEQKAWLWYNGMKVHNCGINDSEIRLPFAGLVLKLDHAVILQSEKKIQTVMRKLVKYLPGFEQIIPDNFLMAEEIKWLSKGELFQDGRLFGTAPVIHERVDFNLS